jgi:hypothetical protein
MPEEPVHKQLFATTDGYRIYGTHFRGELLLNRDQIWLNGVDFTEQLHRQGWLDLDDLDLPGES